MEKILDYQIISTLYHSDCSLVCKASRATDKNPVILKVLEADFPSAAMLARYQQEFEILTHLESLTGVPTVYGLEKYHNSLVMILEDFGGISLKKFVHDHAPPLPELLKIIIQIVTILSDIHSKGIIHKDINPANIIIHPETHEIKLIDFGIASMLNHEKQLFTSLDHLEGTLSYMSPEQTGRLNRLVDYRSDFYALGVTLYEIFTGRLPFISTDLMELVHCHLALMPDPAVKINPDLPAVISDIIMRLMEKMVEDRYQNAAGILADLNICLKELEETGEIDHFFLGQHDFVDRFQVPQHLYGREQEVKALLTAFERVSHGHSEIMLILGTSGVGKSSLVQEIYKPVTEKRGYFISGKFEMAQRNVPYSALVHALRDLMRQFLGENSQRIQYWRRGLLTAIGEQGQILIDVIPELELIIGKQAAVPSLGTTETQNRFNLLFTRMLRVLCQHEHPVVIFLDDLQWADSASLQLIKLMLDASNSQYLFLIGAYGQKDVTPKHPLMFCLESIQETGTLINALSLFPLSLPYINQYIADTLSCSPQEVTLLTNLVIRKTEGSPFFTAEFLKSLHEKNLLYFNYDTLKWEWDIPAIQACDITDNVVDLMVYRIQKLPDTTQAVLKLAACIGSRFYSETLALVYEHTIDETVDELWHAVHEGLVLNLGKERHKSYYKFSHERIQQAVISLLSIEEQKKIHQKIGLQLLYSTPKPELEKQVFIITEHLNSAVDIINYQPDRDHLAELNLLAGQKAKAATAYEPAFNHLKLGIELLGDSGWERYYDVALSLYTEAAEAAYLTHDYVSMEQYANTVSTYARCLLDTVKIYEIEIQAYVIKNQPDKALYIGLQILELLGVKLPSPPSLLQQYWSTLRTRFALLGQPVYSLDTWPKMCDPLYHATMRILASIAGASYSSASSTYHLLVNEMVWLSTRHGHAPATCFAYAAYGLILCAEKSQIDLGYQFVELALKLADDEENVKFKAKTLVIANGYGVHWKQHIQKTLIPLLDAYKSGINSGDLEYASRALFVHSYHSLFAGQALSDVNQQITQHSDNLSNIHQLETQQWLQIYRQMVLNLLGDNTNPCELVGDACNEYQLLNEQERANNYTTLFSLYLNKMILCYLFYKYEDAQHYANNAKTYLSGVKGSLLVSLFYFYDSLISLRQYPQQDNQQQRHTQHRVEANQRYLHLWAKHAPENFQHKALLVEAEYSRVLGNDKDAREYYEKAAVLSLQYGYSNDNGLIYQLAGELALQNQQTQLANHYIRSAHYAYQRWGAVAKYKELEQRYPQTFSQLEHLKQGTTTSSTVILKTMTTSMASNGTSHSTQQSNALDFTSIFKATETIAGEIQLNSLLEKLMRIMIENAGAQRGVLFLHDNNEWYMEAEGESAGANLNIHVLQNLSMESSKVNIPRSMVNYVIRTKERLIYTGETKDQHFSRDIYLIHHKPKQILCLPLLNQGKLTGVLYLENKLTVSSFNEHRLEVLNFLSTQVAISLANAKLYADTKALNDELSESEERFRIIAETTPVALTISCVSDGLVLYANGQAARTFEIPAEKMVNHHYFTEFYYNRDDRKKVLNSFNDKGLSEGFEVELKTVKGRAFWATCFFQRIVFNEREAILSAFYDMTDRKLDEEERIRLNNELKALNKAYERFIPREFIHLLEKKSVTEVQLGDQVEKEMTILFSDIRGFTPMSESMTPQENFDFINAYLSRMEPVIHKHNGFIDKYIGDAIMALFSSSVDNAIQGCLEMLRTLRDYNKERVAMNFQAIEIGIGLNTGPLMLGTVGGKNRMDGTVISDAVNVASRIEGLTKVYGAHLLITGSTFKKIEDTSSYHIRLLDRVRVKGKRQAVTVYEIFDCNTEAQVQLKKVTLRTFEKGVEYFHAEEYIQARQCFQQVLANNPEDAPAAVYFKRCESGDFLNNNVVEVVEPHIFDH